MPRPHRAVLLPLTTALAVGRTVLLTAFPHGGQHTSRRNAWAAMAADAGRARARREAAVAVALAQALPDGGVAAAPSGR